MTAPSPRTWSPGETLTAALLNTEVRDSLIYAFNTPRCYVYQGTAATNVATSGTAVVMLWDAEQWDTDSMHSLVTNTSRLTATTAGLYEVRICGHFVANTTGLREITVRKNAAGAIGSGTQVASFRAAATSAGTGQVGGSFEVSLAANDYLEAFANQNSGGALALTLGASYTFASMRWVAAS